MFGPLEKAINLPKTGFGSLVILTLIILIFYILSNEDNPGTISSLKKVEIVETKIIDIVQIILGEKSCHQCYVSLKSILHHHKAGGIPIRLHIVCDRASRLIMESVLSSWQPAGLSYEFYSGTTYYRASESVRSSHHAARFGPIKLFIPEILRGTTKRTLYIDCDTIILGDIEELWNQFDKFNSTQAVGMSYDNYRGIKYTRGRKPLNSGVLMWDIERLNQEKWNKLWIKAYSDIMKTTNSLGQTEQTLFNYALYGVPDLLFEMPCRWSHPVNKQPDWNSCTTSLISHNVSLGSPMLFHLTQTNKYESVVRFEDDLLTVANAEELIRFFIHKRSSMYKLDGDTFRPRGKQVLGLDFRKVLDFLHPEERIIMLTEICRPDLNLCGSVFLPTVGSYDSYHRIYPIYMYKDFSREYPQGNQICLILTLHNKRFVDLVFTATLWEGCISVAFYASDLEAELLLSRVENSTILSKRQNIAYHVVYPLACPFTNVILHNTASIFSPKRANFYVRNSLSPLLNRSEFQQDLNEFDALVYLNITGNLTANLEIHSKRCEKQFEGVCLLKLDWLNGPKIRVSEISRVVGMVTLAAYTLIPNEMYQKFENDNYFLLLYKLNLLELD